MAHVENNADLYFPERNMTSEKSTSSCPQALTPPESPLAAHLFVNDFRHLLESVLSDLKEPSNTPLSQEVYQPGPDAIELQKLLNTFLRNGESLGVAEPAQSDPASNEHGTTASVIDEADLSSPICTTPDDFKSFEKWATEQDEKIQPNTGARAPLLEYKRVLERWNEKSCKYEVVDSELAEDDADRFEHYIFVVRERQDRKSERVTRFIDVKSVPLCDVLRKVLQGVRSANMIGDKPSIEEKILFHFLPELKQVMEELRAESDSSAQSLDHLSLLVESVTEANAFVAREVSSLLAQAHITYDLLWALFKPGCFVFTKCLGTGKPRCVVFDAGEEFTRDGVTYYKLETRYFDHDGEKFGEAGMALGILKFRGSKPIESLDAFPICYHPDHDRVREVLVGTGRRFRSLVGKHIRRCDGTAFIMKDGEPIKMNINSCVGVHAAFFNNMQPNYSRPRVHDRLAPKTNGFQIISLSDEDRMRDMEKVRSNDTDLDQMSEEEFLICSPTVCGFSFQEKLFMEFAVDDLSDMRWFPESFDCLSIPHTSKRLLLSLAKTRLSRTPMIAFDDFVAGKGRGLNVLLHGPPGVGKTSTVEAAAEYFNLPLYSISAGELDVDHGNPNALDVQLKRIFKIAKHFDALLLLDEADAWMDRRIASYGGHNRLVTVILRNLEYYEGILFLTTNRAAEFDEAVLSRIHLKIKYGELPKSARREIWAFFLSKANTHQGPAIVSDAELRRLESLALNGRDIKNLTSTAHALASDAGQQVSYDHLQTAAEANEKFLKEFGHNEGMYI
ncbi:hypothetical protein N7478_000771 [Penicillium angulare]|uniref:uncharacterized protein n=1 Tax=Penicillium angulare TaxID=116970 RepID=UPI0025426831|nr:uncharacterized protein N7478_000771 [Penicillium angulare]KAJ5291520.1 hypothetical protein N7478_000771 [Penicillium angulare]